MNSHFDERKGMPSNNILSMTSQQRCDFLHARLELLHAQDKHWGYKHVAELCGLSEATVRSIITDPEYDPRISSLQDLCNVMGENFGQDIIYQDTPETVALIAAKDEEIRQLTEAVARLTETVHRLRDNIDFHVEEAKMKTAVIKNLLEAKEKI